MAYSRLNKKDGEVLTASDVTHIEDGIVQNENDISDVNQSLSNLIHFVTVRLQEYDLSWTQTSAGVWYANIVALADLGISSSDKVVGLTITNFGSMSTVSVPYVQSNTLRISSNAAQTSSTFTFIIQISYLD